MINPDYENYGKPFHYLLSPSIWLDIDSFIYIVVVAMLTFLVVRIVKRGNNTKNKINLIDFLAKYMLACSAPVFFIFFIQLIISGQWTANNLIVSFLPIVYGVIIQLIFTMVRKIIRRRRKNDK